MSSDLVPLSHARDAYNALYGTELETHTDALNAEQTARINNNYDIELHVGTHGLPLGARPDNPHALMALPTQQEYQEAAAVVAGMRPGDTLFVERYGFNSQPLEPIMVPDHLPAAPEEGFASPMQRMLGDLALTMMRELNGEAARRLEQSRKDYKISAWDYAYQLAELKGIRTVFVDHDAFEKESLQTLTKGKSLMELTRSSNDEDRALAGRIHTQRERKARNMMKDWALEHLPSKETPAPEGRKPKLVLLFGGAHKEGLERTFSDIGLDANVTVMKSTNTEERAAEQVVRVAGNLMTLMPSLILNSMGDLTALAAKESGTAADRLKAFRKQSGERTQAGPRGSGSSRVGRTKKFRSQTLLFKI